MRTNCPSCMSKNIETSSHLHFDKGVYTHRCKDCKTQWEGEKYQHNKYPEHNLEVAENVKCSFCHKIVSAYMSPHFRFDEKDIGYRCSKCGGCWTAKSG